MILYEYACPKCQFECAAARSMAKREDGPWCNRCQKQMKLQISAVRGIVKNPAAGRSRRV